ncbi:hypothetical protein CY34DRAFT_243307 [Suillus luteus UH-Slu-Lm8-n1]|uniref:Uncharacterized protein n=1 Tax=Suillus luteus UH-Slu-Lm8-n1 TaxID=930992 RepID=A0A0D0B2Z0_9AGAM|nr:hypothetical protein CY34DRAFT_243307 [Suillus luteus UH-Slu-Lm8-n1]
MAVPPLKFIRLYVCWFSIIISKLVKLESDIPSQSGSFLVRLYKCMPFTPILCSQRCTRLARQHLQWADTKRELSTVTALTSRRPSSSPTRSTPTFATPSIVDISQTITLLTLRRTKHF